MTVQIIAHRGFSSVRPENTFASFEHAINSGFNLIELDVHLSKDGVPVVMHDVTVDRTSNGSGPIKSKTLDELKQLDAGSWFPKDSDMDFGIQRIPTLEEIISTFRSKAHVFIEIKSEEEDLLFKTRDIIKDYGLLKSNAGNLKIPGVSMISFNKEQLVRSKNIMPELMHGYLVIYSDLEDIQFCVSNSLDGYFPHIGTLSRDLIISANKNNISVGVWGAEKPEDLLPVKDLGLSGVTVDWPDLVEKLLKQTS